MTANATQHRLVDSKEAHRRAAAAKPTSEVREALESGDTSALEALLMAKVEGGADETEFFLVLLATLVKRRRYDDAELFLQFIVDALHEQKRDGVEVALVVPLLAAWPDSKLARERTVALLRERYADRPNFTRLVEHFAVAKAADPLAAFEQVETWLCYDTGRIVYAPVHGVGKISDINLTLGTVKVEFPDQGTTLESYRIGEAQRLLQVLPEGHFLRDKHVDRDSLQKLAESDPGEILRRVFESEQRTLTTAELKQILTGVVAPAAWTSWWSRARHDPRLTIGSGARPVCTWAGSAEQAGDTIEREFRAAAPIDKVTMALKNAGRSPQLAAMMHVGLQAAAESLKSAEPATALELLLAADRIGSAPAALPAAIDRADIESLVPYVADRNLRRRALSLIKERRPDWAAIYERLLRRESDSQAIGQMYAALRDTDAGRLDTLVGQALADPLVAPALYLWLGREMTGRDELKPRADWRFLQGLLAALGNQSLKGHFAALRKLFDPGGVVDEVVKKLEPDQARDLIAALDKGAGLEEYRRESLQRFIRDRHAHLRQDKKEVLFTTAESLEAKRAEFEKLIKVDIPHNTEEMIKAKAHGDLRENFEYHAARARQEMLSSRAKTLADQLTIARGIDPATVDPSAIAIGTRVALKAVDSDDAGIALTVLGLWDSDPNNHIVSYLAPAIHALIGSKPGDEVEYDGNRYRVGAIEIWRTPPKRTP